MRSALSGILFLLVTHGYSQGTTDDLKFYICPDQRTEIYEGELLNICFCIENSDNREKQIDMNVRAVITSIKNESGEEIVYNDPYRHFDPGTYRDFSYPVVKPMPAHFKSCKFISPAVISYGTNRLSDYSPEIREKYKRFNDEAMPRFFKPGTYTAVLELLTDGPYKGRTLTHTFRVIAPEGTERSELETYMNALSSAFLTDDPKTLVNNNGNSLFEFLKNFPNSVYADEVFRMLAVEFPSSPFMHLYNDPGYLNYVYEVFLIIPTLPELSPHTGSLFFISHFSKIREFREKGLIAGERQFIEDLLKGLENFDYSLSEIIIRKAKEAYNITGLTNYGKRN